jgi:hypothetical protein
LLPAEAFWVSFISLTSARQTAVVNEALRRLPEMTTICLLMTLRLMALTARNRLQA